MTETRSERGSITKEIRIDASPEVVYDAISSPEHIAQWWTDEADFDPAPGGAGTLVWRERGTVRRAGDYTVHISIVEALRGERFSFRWLSPDGDAPTTSNSMLVTFTLLPDGDGTLLTVTEEGMRDQGWEAAVLEEYYTSHDDGWARHLTDLAAYAGSLAAESGRQ